MVIPFLCKRFQYVFDVFLQVHAPKMDTMTKILLVLDLNPVDSMVLYSSIAALMGSPGQTVYSSSNAVLDALSLKSLQCGKDSISIQWGAWASAGMATQDKSTSIRLERLGIGTLEVDLALNAFESALSSYHGVISVIPFDWERVGETAPAHLLDFMDDFVTLHVTHVAKVMQQETVQVPSGFPPVEVIDIINSALTNILGSSVGHEEPLMAAGLDSLGAVELRNTLENEFKVQLPSTLVFDYPTVSTMSDFIQTLFGDATVEDKVIKPIDDSSGDTAVCIKFSTQMSPKDALRFEEEVDGIGIVPYSRWDIECLGALTARFGAYMDSIDLFDSSAFSISNSEAALIDPQQRLLLESIGHCMVLDQNACSPFRKGVYVGLASSDYGSLVHQYAEKGAFHATSNALSVACGRISYTFGLQGPSLSIDTACSSSLVATHLGARSIAEERAEICFAAGVHLQCTPTSTSYVWAASMLSPSGRCQALDASADGYVRGEMCAALVLGALSDSDVYIETVVIKGSAVNQDGRWVTIQMHSSLWNLGIYYNYIAILNNADRAL